MPEKVMPGPVEDPNGIREAVCIHTRKIYDSCREEDIASYKFLQKRAGQPASPIYQTAGSKPRH